MACRCEEGHGSLSRSAIQHEEVCPHQVDGGLLAGTDKANGLPYFFGQAVCFPSQVPVNTLALLQA